MLSLVVDTNILFSYFWKNAYTRELMPQTWLYTPTQAFRELERHREYIQQRTGLTEKEFSLRMRELKQEVIAIAETEYKDKLQSVSSVPDKDDADFVALALAMDAPLWSNDKRLQAQDLVLVTTTESLVKTLAACEPRIFGSNKDRAFLRHLVKTKAFKAELKEAELATEAAHKKAFG